MTAADLLFLCLFLCDTLGILDIKLSLVDLGEDDISDYTENAVCDPVYAESGRHDEADPDRHDGHENIHCLHRCLGLCTAGGGIGRLAYLHRQPGQKRSDKRDKEQSQCGKCGRGICKVNGPDLPVGDLAEVHAKEAVVKIHELVRQIAQCVHGGIPMLMKCIGNTDLVIGLVGRNKACILSRPLGDLLNALRAYAHHLLQRLANDTVQCDDDRERKQAPEAAGHGVDALFTVKLGDLLLILFLVIGILFLQRLHLGLETGGAHHALLALCHERQKNEVNYESKEDDGNTVVLSPIVQELH